MLDLETMSELHIDPRIASAKTLSTLFYTDPRMLEESKEKIFSRSWHYIDASGENGAGVCVPVTLLEDFIDEPLMLAQSRDSKLRCLSNVCTHRGAILVDKECKLNDIRCRYHGRRFSLDGKFLSMPEFKEVENFPSPDDDLRELPLFQIGKLLFTSLGADQPQIYFSEMLERIGWLPLDKMLYRPEFSKDYTVNAHWALYCENYLEGFHIPFVHPGLNQVIDFSNYTTELFRYSNLQLGTAKPDELVFDIPESSPDFGKRIGGYYFWVFPNMMFNFYPWGLSLNIVRPKTINQTTVSFYTFINDESKFNQGAGSDLNQVEMEDEEVVESVQRGIRSRYYQHGRYSVKHEKGTHHFHQIVSEFMNAS